MTDMTNQAINWTKCREVADARQAVLRLLRPGRHARPASCAEGVDRQVQGQVRPGLGQAPRGDAGPADRSSAWSPPDTKLAPKPEAIKDWDKLTADEKKLFARQMEVFAGYGEYADHEIGRLIQAIEDLGQLDNTLVFYIVGDNGASAEGGMNGLFNEMTYFNGVHETVEDILKHYDELGGPNSYGHYAAGWAVAGDTPFTWTKQVAGSYGGTRNGMVVHWPKRIKAKGEMRSQWHHVIDIAPTILEAAGLPEPKSVNGTPQTPIEGVSMVYTFDDAKAKDRHTTQYFEIFGNRAIYHDGWLADTVHRAAWEAEAAQAALEDDMWELYDTPSGLQPGERPGREESREAQGTAGPVHEGGGQDTMSCRSTIASLERVNAALVGRPDLMAGPHLADGLRGHDRDDGERLHQHQEPVAHHHRRGRDSRRGGANGVILCQAGRFGGWSLYLKDGKPTYTYNFLGLERFNVAAAEAVPGGQGDDPLRVRLRRRQARARAARARSSSTARRSPKGGSTERRAMSSRPTKAPTSAWTAGRR